MVERLAICRKCGTEVQSAGGTTNLFSHLNRRHPDINIETFKGSPFKETAVKPVVKTLSIMDAFARKYTPGSARPNEITAKIGDFIVKDLRPYSIVDSKSFRAMVKALDPKYTVPSRKHFSETVIPTMYRKVAEEVKKRIKEAEQVAITTDGWTSRATESFITITCSFINDDWQMVNYVLQTRVLSESHTGMYFCQFFICEISFIPSIIHRHKKISLIVLFVCFS